MTKRLEVRIIQFEWSKFESSTLHIWLIIQKGDLCPSFFFCTWPFVVSDGNLFRLFFIFLSYMYKGMLLSILMIDLHNFTFGINQKVLVLKKILSLTYIPNCSFCLVNVKYSGHISNSLNFFKQISIITKSLLKCLSIYLTLILANSF